MADEARCTPLHPENMDATCSDVRVLLAPTSFHVVRARSGQGHQRALAQAPHQESGEGDGEAAEAGARRGAASVRDLNLELGELRESMEEDEDADEDDEVNQPRGRRDERGRYVALDWKLRELILAEEARRTPTTAIAANISDVTSSVEVGRRSVKVRRGPSPPDHW